ncbi:hypothetical protein [Roseovarius sp. 2305UL8-3]|uniref:hypothetical protein n=1 Tax=Roseovarius conchicola TaxID=3121636 RepID=UPI0035284BB7
MRSYEAARGYFSFLTFVSWCVIVLGGIAVLGGLAAVGQMGRGFGSGPNTFAIIGAVIPGAGLAFAGFMGLVFAQIGRAGVDSAEYGQQMLQIARDQLDVSRRGLNKHTDTPQSFAVLKTPKADQTAETAQHGYPQSKPTTGTPSETEAKPSLVAHNGHEIEFRDDQYIVDGRKFEFLTRAKHYVDTELASNRLGAPEETIEHAGRIIELRDGKYHYSSMTFASREAAERYIDQLGVNPNVKLS